MKNTKLITLGFVLAGATLTLAQDLDVVRKLPPVSATEDVLIERDMAAADQASQVARTLEGAEKRVRLLAQAGPGGMDGGRYVAQFGGDTTQRAPRALVIPKDANDAKNLGEVEEDLAVMAHILDKAVSSDDKTARAMGITVFGKITGAAFAPQNFYIDGAGAIFLLNVNYPLLPPPNKEVEAETKEPVNNEWEEARREMARPNKSHGGADPFLAFGESFGADGAWNLKVPAVEYNENKVAELKKDLIAALKNAANIRRLKSDETITVVVSGAEAGVVKAFKSTGSKPGRNSERVVVTKEQSGERARTDAARLILRVRKSDADAFQNGKLNFDDFRKKVTTMLY